MDENSKSNDLMLPRTMLFIPGNQPRMLRKGATLGADAVILDLEEAVPLEEKDAARNLIRDCLDNLDYGSSERFVRINPLTTESADADLRAMVSPKPPEGIVLPKVEKPEEIERLDQLISRLEKENCLSTGRVKIIPIIETAKGILSVNQLLQASRRITAVAFGAEDFTADINVTRTKSGKEIFYARCQIVLAKAAAGIAGIDTPFLDISDEDGLIEDARTAAHLGFDGKLVIHPSQIEPVNKVFTPSDEEVKWAKKVVATYERMQKEGIAVTTLEGKMIDMPVVLRAKKLILKSQKFT